MCEHKLCTVLEDPRKEETPKETTSVFGEKFGTHLLGWGENPTAAVPWDVYLLFGDGRSTERISVGGGREAKLGSITSVMQRCVSFVLRPGVVSRHSL